MADKPKPKAKPPRKKAGAKPKSQRERFIEAARAQGADESGTAFERAFRSIVTARRRV
jgi:hypothetical protein